MAVRPQILCTLVKDKVLDVQPNFVATFNWLVSCIDNLKGVDGIDVEEVSMGKPVVRPSKNPDTPLVDLSGLDNLHIVTSVVWDPSAHAIVISGATLSASSNSVSVIPDSEPVSIPATPLSGLL